MHPPHKRAAKGGTAMGTAEQQRVRGCPAANVAARCPLPREEGGMDGWRTETMIWGLIWFYLGMMDANVALWDRGTSLWTRRQRLQRDLRMRAVQCSAHQGPVSREPALCYH